LQRKLTLDIFLESPSFRRDALSLSLQASLGLIDQLKKDNARQHKKTQDIVSREHANTKNDIINSMVKSEKKREQKEERLEKERKIAQQQMAAVLKKISLILSKSQRRTPRSSSKS
jgi:uncharacterized protein YaiL (DUF2058 family)